MHTLTGGVVQSKESPIFDASFWSENGVSCPQCGHERNKIGDSVLWCGVKGRANEPCYRACKRAVLKGVPTSRVKGRANEPF